VFDGSSFNVMHANCLWKVICQILHEVYLNTNCLTKVQHQPHHNLHNKTLKFLPSIFPCLKFKKHLEKVKQKLKALAIFKAAGLHWCQERSNHTEWPRELSSVNTQGLDYFFWLTYTE
jgi:hypothetical protein